MVGAMPDLLFRLDGQGRFLDFHARDEADCWCQPRHFIGKTVHEVIPREVADQSANATTATPSPVANPRFFEYALDPPGGREWFESRLVRVSANEALAIVRDITQRKRTEEALRRAATVRCARSVNAVRLMIRATAEDQLLKDVCRLVVEAGGYGMAWIGGAETDVAHTVRPLAQFGGEEDYLAGNPCLLG